MNPIRTTVLLTLFASATVACGATVVADAGDDGGVDVHDGAADGTVIDSTDVSEFDALPTDVFALDAPGPDSPGGTDVPVADHPDVATDRPIVEAGVGDTYTFVVDQLAIDPTDNPDIAHTGLDLDSLFSNDIDPGGCYHVDYWALYDDDLHCPRVSAESCIVAPNPGCSRTTSGCRGGVDNQLPTVANVLETAANVDVRTELSANVTHNRFAMLIRLSGVASLSDDDHVRVALYRGYPTFSTGCTSVAAGRVYAVAASSLVAPASDVDADAAIVADGSITGGRLRFATSESGAIWTLPLPFSPGSTSDLPVHALGMRFDVSATSLDRGVLGGWVTGADFVTAFAAVAPDYATVIRSIIGGLVDIQLAGVCDNSSAMPPEWGAVSIGLGVHAVSAVISTTTPIVGAQTPGTCGY